MGLRDSFVNNVGGSDDKTPRALADTSDEIFRSQMELNLTSAFQGCRAGRTHRTTSYQRRDGQ